MKNQFLLRVALLVLLSTCSVGLSAQNQYWTMAVAEGNSTRPALMTYHGKMETAGNGVGYYRIFDDSPRYRHEADEPVRLQYGYRMADRKIYVYDFEAQKETVAFDFSLSAGDSFRTFNGMAWKVVSATDTLVNTSFCGTGGSVSKRLLSVVSDDGKYSDQWLEDFGSFMNHFMVRSLENVRYSHTLLMEYDYGAYLAREIGSDPIFTHDSGWMDGHYDDGGTGESAKCSFENGTLVYESVRWWWGHRMYSCFYRDGDDIHALFQWELNPMEDNASPALQRDVVTFRGLPAPASGKYTVHNDDGSASIGSVEATSRPAGAVYDLQGRRVGARLTKGIYIMGGQKVHVK